MQRSKILVIDDYPIILEPMKYLLEEQGYEVVTTERGEQGLALVADQDFDIALTDLQLPDINGIELVRRLKKISPTTEIIMISGYGSLKEAINAIKAGAFYFVEKPVKFDELVALIDKAIRIRQQDNEIRRLRDRLTDRNRYLNIIGGSKEMQNVYETIDSVAESDANVMIIGESGTGKELIANAIHFKSQRSKRPFVKINCSALPHELIESELFGHTKGAFTGANTEKMGLIDQATGGSLMLDEIAEMPVELQPKLLRVLQERVYYRLGSEKAHEADFRLISATNRDPREAIQEGRLREDLYYRIDTIEIRVPPLRERTEDVLHLADHFLRMFAEKYQRPVRSISQEAYDRMLNYPWPGNVRELQNVIERAVLLSKDEMIEVSALPFAASEPPQPALAPAAAAAPESEQAAPDESIIADLSFQQIGRIIINKVSEARASSERLDIFAEMEGAIVSAALETTKGNKQAAANLLGVYRPRLYDMLRKHKLHHTIRESNNNYTRAGH